MVSLRQRLLVGVAVVLLVLVGPERCPYLLIIEVAGFHSELKQRN